MTCKAIEFNCGDCVKFNQDTCPTQAQLQRISVSEQLNKLCEANLKERDDYNEINYNIRDILYNHLPEYCTDLEVDKTKYTMCLAGKQWIKKETK